MLIIGQNLYLERIRKGMTQKELVQRTGIAQANISNIEKGKNDFTITTLYKICAALDVKPAKVFESKAIARKNLWVDRPTLMRVAEAAVTGEGDLSEKEGYIAIRLKKIIKSSAISGYTKKEIELAWYELKEALVPEELTTLLERASEIEKAKRWRKH